MHNPGRLGAAALTVGSVPRRIIPKTCENLGTILPGTDPTVSATAPGGRMHEAPIVKLTVQ